MPIRLDTVLRKVEHMPNKVNSDLLKEFYQHMKDNGTSQNYQKGNLKAIIHFAEFIGERTRALPAIVRCSLYRLSSMVNNTYSASSYYPSLIRDTVLPKL
jgi:hypothetical protein